MIYRTHEARSTEDALRDLRHYFATVLIFGGANVKTVQLVMGHTTPTITLNTYVGFWPDAVDQTRTLVLRARLYRGCTRGRHVRRMRCSAPVRYR